MKPGCEWEAEKRKERSKQKDEKKESQGAVLVVEAVSVAGVVEV